MFGLDATGDVVANAFLWNELGHVDQIAAGGSSMLLVVNAM